MNCLKISCLNFSIVVSPLESIVFVTAQQRHTRLPKRIQAKIVEACLEGGLLFDCAVRTWWVSDVKRLQSWIDRCYRYVWNKHHEPPQKQMQWERMNMQDVRNGLGVRSIRWNIDREVLERMGHVMTMDDGRITKAAILGWFGELEEWKKAPREKRKTVLYWKKMTREVGWDIMDKDRVAKDRKELKSMVSKRMEQLER